MDEMEVAIAILGACIALCAAVVNGIAGRRIAAEIEKLSKMSAALTSDLQRMDRFFDLANRAREYSDQLLIFFHTLVDSNSFVFKPLLVSVENSLYDTLNYNHSAATGAFPDDNAHQQYNLWARSIVQTEKALALGDPKKRENASAVSEFKAAREKHIADYWEKRSQILSQQEELKSGSDQLRGRRERINNLALSLQILGLMVVLAKDLLK